MTAGGRWEDLRWFVVFNGIADRWLWGFDADGWRLRHGEPAAGSLGLLPGADGRVATLDDARWLADALAYDHDAPVGVSPAMGGMHPAPPTDGAAQPPTQPIHPFVGTDALWYWQTLNQAYGAAAELRFNGSYVIRYDQGPASPGTDFSARFKDREELVGLYAMASRQADPLAEYLCLYRVLEAADGRNGKDCSDAGLPDLPSTDFGALLIIGHDDDPETASNAFETYRARASLELDQLAARGVRDIPDYLYQIRHSLAHGKRDGLTTRNTAGFMEAARALPVVKLLARIAIDPYHGR